MLDVDIEIGLKRRSSDQDSWNRLDAKEQAFHQRVRAGYLDLAQREPQRFFVIDAGVDEQAVRAQIETVLRTHFKRR